MDGLYSPSVGLPLTMVVRIVTMVITLVTMVIRIVTMVVILERGGSGAGLGAGLGATYLTKQVLIISELSARCGTCGLMRNVYSLRNGICMKSGMIMPGDDNAGYPDGMGFQK